MSIEEKLAIELDASSSISIFLASAGYYSVGIRIRREEGGPGLFEEFRREFGGTVAQSKKDGAWWYNILAKKALNAVVRARPYIRKKGEHADLVIQLYESITRHVQSGRYRPLSEEERHERQAICLASKELNRAASGK